jgi:NitT/TauT family transport system ATP-binding protein
MAHPALQPALQRQATPASSVRVTQLAQVFERDRPPVLDRIDFDVAPGEFVCLLGASGCGKSTLLSLIAGLGTPTSGSIEVTVGRPALMFQEPALLPWLTAAGNVELALKARGVGRVVSGYMSFPEGCASGWRWPAPWPRTAGCC